MSEKNRLQRINSSKYSILFLCIGILLIMLLCNFKTNLIADDYRYCFSFYDGSRIGSVSDILKSMSAHRFIMNGRVIAHFLVQLFLLLPLPVFKVLNSFVFVLLIYLIYRISIHDSEHNSLLFAALFGAIWVLQPEFGQVFLWLDGAVNYLWCGVLCLLWLLPLIECFRSGDSLSVPTQISYCVFSFIVGAYCENSTVAMVFMSLLFSALSYYYRKEKIRLWRILALVSMLLGFLLMIFAPAELANKSASSLSALLSNFAETGLYYLRFWPLLILYAALFFYSLNQNCDADTRTLSLVFFGGSLAGHFVLVFALYCTGRSTFITLVLLLCACGVLFSALFKGKSKGLLCLVCAVCLCFTAYSGYLGITDILQTNYKLSYNESIILEAVENGEQIVQLPRPYAETKYSAVEGLPYLNTDDPSDWPNEYMARFYNVQSIVGY